MSARKGLRRAQVLAVLSHQPQKIGQLVKATGLKWQIVENVLDAPSVACLVDVDARGYTLKQTSEAVQQHAEAVERVSALTDAIAQVVELVTAP